MAKNNINAYCSICGKGYHICNSCQEQKTLRPWRTITDTIEHYKIYMAIHSYTLTKNKENAKQLLQRCDLSEIKNFNPEIKNVIREITSEEKAVKPIKANEKKQNITKSKEE